ncbi:MAG: Na+/H+ antiporter NhaA [Gammaproteobacteria bacterium]|jgi:NhaA family Na+:H+ antiporter|nr:Na+/H+ antiporter NhaA [Gammaproteobacteria bacterium]
MHRHSSAAAKPFSGRIFSSLERFLHVEAASGIVLLAAAVLALSWANSPLASSYEALWHTPFTIGFGTLIVAQPLHFWINDGLMTVFFLVVGLEIRREMHEGALSSVRLAALPVAAALGGILVPALIYLAFNTGPLLRRGWAIPTATDIAFALGVLAILGARVPPALRVLLLALAIVDDLAAILVIAFFYSAGLAPAGFIVAGLGVLGVLAFRWLGFRHALAYTLPGFIVWFGFLQAGVHPTLAGVVLGLLTPVATLRGRQVLLTTANQALEEYRERSQLATGNPHELVQPVQQLGRAQREMLAPVLRVEATLHPWVAYGIMPLFALANAGVSLQGLAFGDPASRAVSAGIAVALVVGKPLGIVLAAWLAVKSGIAALPAAVNWRGLLLVGLLGGIGFTMSIFIANLSFADPGLVASAKLAVLIGSAVAGLSGLLIGRWILQSEAGKLPP